MWSVSDIRCLECEISTVCNAGCVDCNRWIWNPNLDTVELNTLNPYINQLVDVDVFVARLKQFSDLKQIVIQGNMGDPLTHHQLPKLIKKVFDQFPGLIIEIDTNGSVGSTTTWKEMSKLADQNINFCFNIDGLHDTNHIYRRGCRWNKIMENSKLWIDAGGSAEWRMIDFPYNAHQRDQAKILSEQMGFKSFTVRQRYSPTVETDQWIEQMANEPVIPVHHSHSDHDVLQELDVYHKEWQEWPHHVDRPACLDNLNEDWHWPSFHLNLEGTVWPCCFTSNLLYYNGYDREIWKKINQKYVEKYSQHWNNLDYYTLEEILKTDWFTKDLYQSWQSKTEQSLLLCRKNCSSCNQSYTQRKQKEKNHVL